MALQKLLNRTFTFVIFFAALQLFTAQAQATLVFYYDPDTGNVSFDTAETRTGDILLYILELYPQASSIRFREENHILVFGSSAFSSDDLELSEVSFLPTRGTFTLGDVLPPNLAESTWASLFSGTEGSLGRSNYIDLIGTGRIAPPAEFIYGRPEGEFDNKWDLVDPDSLDWAQEAKLIYRQATGELIYDTSGEDGGYTVGFYLQSDGHFLPQEFVAPWESPFNSASSDQIDMLANAVEPGAYSLGNILQPGLSRTEYEALITEAHYISRAGFNGGDINLETDGIVMSLVFEAVPEPSTALLMSIACGAILTRRRKAH